MPDDRYRRELAKLRRAEIPNGLWERVQEGPRMAPLGPEPRDRVVAAIVALTVFGVAAFLAWHAFRPSDQIQPARWTTIQVPPRGQTSAMFLEDGRPVFVVRHEDGTVSVVDAFSSHRAWGVEDMTVWCPTTREFVELAHEARFDEFGGFAAPPAPGGLVTWGFRILQRDAAGDPMTIRVTEMLAASGGGGNSDTDRAPFCPAGNTSQPGLTEVTGAYSGDSGMVLTHRIIRDRVWGTPQELLAAAPSGWSAVRATMHVDDDGFVQLCARVVDDRCDGGVIVRGIDGIGLYLNVTRFDWVSGYEEPQVWLVKIRDGVFDDPAAFVGVVGASD